MPLSVSFSESDPRTTTPVADLSRTGALVLGGPMHPIGSRVELRFVAFPDDPQPFVHTGRVVRHLTRPDPMGRDLEGMGIEFDALPQDVATRLDTILERAANEDLRRQRRSKRVRLDSTTINAHDLRTRILSK